MTKQEKYLRDLMQKNQVSQSEVAEHEGISEQAVNQQLLRLTPSKVEHLEAIIIRLSNKKITAWTKLEKSVKKYRTESNKTIE